MDTQPLISVIICTHNRAGYLGKAINSVLSQTMACDDYELIVVDNRSTDSTREVVESFSHATHMRYVFEPELGLSYARNTGWRSAKGRYAAYLDDDAIALSGWLEAIRDAFATTPIPGIIGGRVDPIWEGGRPPWLSDEIAMSLAILNWSDKPKQITDVGREWLVGTNLAIPIAVLTEVGGFHPWLDRVGHQMLSSGEVFLQKQIIQRGYPCLFIPSMAVRHHIPSSRLQKQWFVRRYYGQGLSDFLMQLLERRPSYFRRMGIAAFMAARLLVSPVKLCALVLPTNHPGWLTKKYFALIKVGHIAGLLGALKK